MAEKIVFVKTPKTAGTSVRENQRKALLPLPHRNQNRAKRLTQAERLTPAILKLIHQQYGDDFKFFEYTTKTC